MANVNANSNANNNNALRNIQLRLEAKKASFELELEKYEDELKASFEKAVEQLVALEVSRAARIAEIDEKYSPHRLHEEVQLRLKQQQQQPKVEQQPKQPKVEQQPKQPKVEQQPKQPKPKQQPKQPKPKQQPKQQKPKQQPKQQKPKQQQPQQQPKVEQQPKQLATKRPQPTEVKKYVYRDPKVSLNSAPRVAVAVAATAERKVGATTPVSIKLANGEVMNFPTTSKFTAWKKANRGAEYTKLAAATA